MIEGSSFCALMGWGLRHWFLVLTTYWATTGHFPFNPHSFLLWRHSGLITGSRFLHAGDRTAECAQEFVGQFYVGILVLVPCPGVTEGSAGNSVQKEASKWLSDGHHSVSISDWNAADQWNTAGPEFWPFRGKQQHLSSWSVSRGTHGITGISYQSQWGLRIRGLSIQLYPFKTSLLVIVVILTRKEHISQLT